MNIQLKNIAVEKVSVSKIKEVDFDKLTFGSVFSDHMLECTYKNGAWSQPKVVPYQPITLDPSSKIFHYGQSIFEGMKAYKDVDGGVWLFRPLENQKRLNISAKRMAIPELPELIEEKYSRSANGGVGFAKAGGNYAGQFYPTQLAKEKGYDQVIWTDDHKHEYIEEAGAMNIFIRINDTLITGPTSDRILDGITRKSILDIAKDEGITTEVRKINVTEVVAAAKSGALKEMFGAGTAAVVSPISGFGYKGLDYDLPELENSYAMRLKKRITDIQYNRAEDKFGWRHKVL